MAQVTVTIDEKAYRMACEEGQEEHLMGLATRFDRYVGHLKSQFGEIGDLRLTVMASIMIMDELTENERRMKALENEVESLRRTRDSAAARSEKTDEQIAGSIAEMADRVERLSAKLHGAPAA